MNQQQAIARIERLLENGADISIAPRGGTAAHLYDEHGDYKVTNGNHVLYNGPDLSEALDALEQHFLSGG